MHLKKVLLSISLLLTGCAERGYNVTSNITTHTATAQSSSEITKNQISNKNKFEKMKKTVKLELSKQETRNNTKPIKNKKHNSTSPRFTQIVYKYHDTDSLVFKRINQTYQKFGNSEIHGHVIYLSSTGKELRLKNTSVYLLSKSTVLDNWYQNSYLTNKHSALKTQKVYFSNTTHLNLSKNFAFHGIAPGEYYVIIVSDRLDKDNKNEKIYIAKKIKVEKHKKIMAVFSKKL